MRHLLREDYSYRKGVAGLGLVVIIGLTRHRLVGTFFFGEFPKLPCSRGNPKESPNLFGHQLTGPSRGTRPPMKPPTIHPARGLDGLGWKLRMFSSLIRKLLPPAHESLTKIQEHFLPLLQSNCPHSTNFHLTFPTQFSL